jgi:hypothetical protein
MDGMTYAMGAAGLGVGGSLFFLCIKAAAEAAAELGVGGAANMAIIYGAGSLLGLLLGGLPLYAGGLALIQDYMIGLNRVLEWERHRPMSAENRAAYRPA